jgi:hypothetical protein
MRWKNRQDRALKLTHDAAFAWIKISQNQSSLQPAPRMPTSVPVCGSAIILYQLR